MPTETSSAPAESPFETTAETELDRSERWKSLYREFVYAPFSIIWSDWRARVGIVITGLYLIAGVLTPFLIEPTQSADGTPLIKPFETLEHPWGTDSVGRDLFSQTLYSIEPILIMVFAGATFSVSLGTIVGTTAGYKGGNVDKILSTITDIFINIPGLPLVIAIAAIFTPRHPAIIGIILVVASWAGLARNIRSQVLTLRDEAFTEAARAMNIPVHKIIARHTLPMLMPYIAINFVRTGRGVIFSGVGLYFIGVLPYTHENWGIMLNNAYNYGALYNPAATHWLLIPMLAILFLTLGFILLAQSFDRVFNARVRTKHAKKDADAEIDEPEEEVTAAARGF